MEDETIIGLYNDRDESAISETDKKYGGYCRTVSYNILQSRPDTEECVNDAYHHTWNAIPPERPRSLKAFVGRITRNLSLNRLAEKRAAKRGGGRYEAVYDELESTINSIFMYKEENAYAVARRIEDLNILIHDMRKLTRQIERELAAK